MTDLNSRHGPPFHSSGPPRHRFSPPPPKLRSHEYSALIQKKLQRKCQGLIPEGMPSAMRFNHSSSSERYKDSTISQTSQILKRHCSSAEGSATHLIHKTLRYTSAAQIYDDAAIDQALQMRRDYFSSAEEITDPGLTQKKMVYVKRRSFAEETRSGHDLALQEPQMKRKFNSSPEIFDRSDTRQKAKRRLSFSNNSTLTFSSDQELDDERESVHLQNEISTTCTSALDRAPTALCAEETNQSYVKLRPHRSNNLIKSTSYTPSSAYQINRRLIVESLAALWVDQQLNHAGSTEYGSKSCSQAAVLAEKLSNSDKQLDVLELDAMELLDHDQELAETVLRDPDTFATEVMDHVLCQLNSNDLYRSHWSSTSPKTNTDILQIVNHGERDVTESYTSENILPARGSRLWIRLTSVPIPLLPVEALYRRSADLTSSSCSFNDMFSSNRSQLVHVYGIVYAISTIQRTYPWQKKIP